MSDPSEPRDRSATYYFEDYELDTRHRILLRRGIRVALTAKCFDLLTLLIQARGETLSREHLLATLWSEDTSEQCLTQHVLMLRRALQELSRDHTFIATVPTKGYRFVADLKAVAPRRATLSEDGDAYHAYLKGCYLLERDDRQAYQAALACFEEAVLRDPSFCAAHVGVAKAYNALASSQFIRPAIGFPHACRAARDALALQPRDPDAISVLGSATLYYDWDHQRAEQLLAPIAAESDDTIDALNLLTWISITRRRLDEALDRAQRAVIAHKSSLRLHATLGLVHLYRDESECSIKILSALRELDSDFFLATYYLGSAFVHAGRTNEGLTLLEEVARKTDFVQAHSSLAYAYCYSGRPNDAVPIVEFFKKRRNEIYVPWYSFALPLVGLERFEEALDALEEAYNERAPWMIFLGVDPRFAALRGNARYDSLVKRVGIAA